METGITILRHGLVLTMDDEGHIFEDGFIIFSPDGIIAVGEEKNFPEEFDLFPCRDMSGHLIMPGMINTHTHLGMVSFRSLADDYKDRLKRFLMPLENNAMTKELAASGLAVIIISDDMREVLLNCNRVLIMRRGRLVGEHNTSDLDEATLSSKSVEY